MRAYANGPYAGRAGPLTHPYPCMTRFESGDLHPNGPEIGKTFHRLSRSNRSRSVVVHDNVVLDSSLVHTKFIVDSIFDFVSKLVFIVSDSEKIVLI